MEESLIVAVIAVAAAVGLVAASVLWATRRAEKRLGRTLDMASNIVRSTLSAADSDQAMDRLAERLAALFDADACSVVLPTDDGRLRCWPTYGYPEETDLTLRDDEAVVGSVYQTGRPELIRKVHKDPRYVEWISGVRSAMVAPLRSQDRVVGALAFESRSRRYSTRDLAVVLPIADQIAAALENLELRVAAETRAAEEGKIRNELQAISAVVMAGVASASDLDAALHSMIREISARMGWESLAVVLRAPDGLFYTRAYFGYPLHLTIVAFKPGEGVIGRVARSGEGRLIDDVSKDPDYLALVSETRSEMCVPLFSGKRVIGVLNAESQRVGAFSESDFRVLNTLGRQMAIVIERAHIADLERAALEKLREADQLKDDFIATVSHELRTPLTSIKGYAQTLLAREDALSREERSAFLQVMVRHCDRLARIVDTLLLVSRMEAGEIGGKPTYMGVTDLLRDAAEAANDEGRVQIDAEHGVGLVTDHFRVHHILRNLLENACKYSPAHSPVLARARMSGEDVVFEILDEGDGIPEDSKDKIFDRFKRLADPGRSGVPGTGLGLYIARRFARDLGGDLKVSRAEEAPWTGARFVLSLPSVVRSHATEGVRVGMQER